MVGALGSGDDLNELLDNETTRAYREGLLTGDMRDPCKQCWTRPWVSKDQLRAEVNEWIGQNGNA